MKAWPCFRTVNPLQTSRRGATIRHIPLDIGWVYAANMWCSCSSPSCKYKIQVRSASINNMWEAYYFTVSRISREKWQVGDLAELRIGGRRGENTYASILEGKAKHFIGIPPLSHLKRRNNKDLTCPQPSPWQLNPPAFCLARMYGTLAMLMDLG